MIRRGEARDLDAMVDVWHAASVLAHDFIDPAYWTGNRAAMRGTYLPMAENWVIEEAGEVAGFCSLAGDRLAALFVRPGSQGRGLGGRLLEHTQSLRERLELSVYAENGRARDFYHSHGFRAVSEGVDAATGHSEWLMEWKAPARGGRGKSE